MMSLNRYSPYLTKFLHHYVDGSTEIRQVLPEMDGEEITTFVQIKVDKESDYAKSLEKLPKILEGIKITFSDEIIEKDMQLVNLIFPYDVYQKMVLFSKLI